LLVEAEKSSPVHHLLLATCYRHAFRIGEALKLTPRNLKNGMLVVRRSKKGKVTRQKPSQELLALIATKRPDELLFPMSNGAHKYSAYRQTDRVLKRLCKLAGIEAHKAHTHAIRHALVHEARRCGVTYPQLTVVLGHADPKSVMHYDIATEQETAQAMAAVVGG
jgi:integrase